MLFFYLLPDIRKLKAALAAPLDFGDADNDGDNASEVSAAKAPTKVTDYLLLDRKIFVCVAVKNKCRCTFLAWSYFGYIWHFVFSFDFVT